MTLIKTSLLNGIAVVMRLLTLLGINKLLAIYVGPVGYAIFGQYQNAMTMITTFASGAINTGVTKYTAEYYNDELKQQTLWQTAGTIALIGTILTSSLIVFFCKPLSILFLKNSEYYSVFLWFAAMLFFFVFNALLLAILNGKKEIGRYVIANIIGSVLTLGLISLLVTHFGLHGVLIGLAVYQSLTFFVTILLCYRAPWFKWHYFFGRLEPDFVKKLLKYTLMAIVSAISIPMSQILVRNYIGDKLSWDDAGYIEAMWRLSAAYLLLVTTTLTLYYLPKLSELSEPLQIKKEILNTYKIVLPSVMIFSLFIYLSRNLLISLLFTKNFIAMEELFAWQLIGDVVKIASWLLGYLYVAKGFFRLYIFSEIFFSLSFFVLVVLLESSLHIKSVTIAHTINYLFHFSFVFYTLKFNRVI